MTVLDLGVGELEMHLPRRVLVREAVIDASPNALDATVDRRHEYDVIEGSQPRRATEGGQEPRTHDAVVDGCVAAARETARRRGSSLRHHRVLRVRLGQP